MSRRKAPAGSTCPTCGLDVAGFALGHTVDGRRTWDRPAYQSAGPSGVQTWHGGLTHIEGGRRCDPANQIAVLV